MPAVVAHRVHRGAGEVPRARHEQVPLPAGVDGDAEEPGVGLPEVADDTVPPDRHQRAQHGRERQRPEVASPLRSEQRQQVAQRDHHVAGLARGEQRGEHARPRRGCRARPTVAGAIGGADGRRHHQQRDRDRHRVMRRRHAALEQRDRKQAHGAERPLEPRHPPDGDPDEDHEHGQRDQPGRQLHAIHARSEPAGEEDRGRLWEVRHRRPEGGEGHDPLRRLILASRELGRRRPAAPVRPRAPGCGRTAGRYRAVRRGSRRRGRRRR